MRVSCTSAVCTICPAFVAVTVTVITRPGRSFRAICRSIRLGRATRLAITRRSIAQRPDTVGARAAGCDPQHQWTGRISPQPQPQPQPPALAEPDAHSDGHEAQQAAGDGLARREGRARGKRDHQGRPALREMRRNDAEAAGDVGRATAGKSDAVGQHAVQGRMGAYLGHQVVDREDRRVRPGEGQHTVGDKSSQPLSPLDAAALWAAPRLVASRRVWPLRGVDQASYPSTHGAGPLAAGWRTENHPALR